MTYCLKMTYCLNMTYWFCLVGCSKMTGFEVTERLTSDMLIVGRMNTWDWDYRSQTALSTTLSPG